MKTFLVLLCLLTCASASIVEAAPMPWTTFSGMVPEAIGADHVACPVPVNRPVEIIVAAFDHGNDGYALMYNADTRIVVFVYHPGRGKSTEIGFGLVDENRHDEIPVIHWRPITDADRQLSICAMMLRPEA